MKHDVLSGKVIVDSEKAIALASYSLQGYKINKKLF